MMKLHLSVFSNNPVPEYKSYQDCSQEELETRLQEVTQIQNNLDKIHINGLVLLSLLFITVNVIDVLQPGVVFNYNARINALLVVMWSVISAFQLITR